MITRRLRVFEDVLANWMGTVLTTKDLERVIPLDHRLRLWLNSDRPSSAVQLLNIVFGASDDLTLLAMIHLARAKGGAELVPAGLDAALVDSLVELAHSHRVVELSAHRYDSFHAFLSYAHEDVNRAECLAGLLKTHGVVVFRDVEQITPGESIAHVLNEGMVQARRNIVLVSAASVNSCWVEREIGFFLSRLPACDRPVMPILIDDVPLPEALTDLFTIDLRGYRGQCDDNWASRRLASLINVCLLDGM
jgi:hypothetical protein